MIGFILGFVVGVVTGPVFLAKVWPIIHQKWDDWTR